MRDTIIARTVNMRYADEFLRLKAAPDLLALRLFPSTKEITESIGAKHALRRIGADFSDKDTACVCVGDGKTPRTAALLAFLTAWQVFSIDPRLSDRPWSQLVNRLTVIRSRVENVRLGKFRRAYVVCVHSHASAADSFKCIDADEISLINIPCCVQADIGREPDIEYTDKWILSEKNLVQIWR